MTTDFAFPLCIIPLDIRNRKQDLQYCKFTSDLLIPETQPGQEFADVHTGNELVQNPNNISTNYGVCDWFAALISLTSMTT